MLAMPVIVVIANLLFRKYYGYHGDSKTINDFLGYSILLVIGVIIICFFYCFKLKQEKEDYSIYVYGIFVNFIFCLLIMLVGPIL
jgi:hypothetical protein